MYWALLFYNKCRLTRLWSRKDVSRPGRVKASPRDYCICDLRLCGCNSCCCIDHPKILLSSQWSDVQILTAEADGGSGFGRDRGRRWQGALHSGRGVRRGSFGVNLKRGCYSTNWKRVYCGWIVCFRAAANDNFRQIIIWTDNFTKQYTHHNYLQPMVGIIKCVVLYKQISRKNQGKEQILTFYKLEPANVWQLHLNNNLNN